MSDGTVRALGILTALFQQSGETGKQAPVPLVGIEEPEAALHPARGRRITRTRWSEASLSRQILVTTSQRRDLLDRERRHCRYADCGCRRRGGDERSRPLTEAGPLR